MEEYYKGRFITSQGIDMFLDLNEIGEKQMKNNLYLNIEKERNSKKLTFYINSSEDDNFQKSKSVLNLPKVSYNNLKIKFHSGNFIKINIILNQINI